MLKYMLDTNIVIYTMKNKPASVRSAFKKHDGRMCISSITFMELVYGAERSANPERNLTSLEGFVARIDVLPLDDSAAVHAGQIRAEKHRGIVGHIRQGTGVRAHEFFQGCHCQHGGRDRLWSA